MNDSVCLSLTSLKRVWFYAKKYIWVVIAYEEPYGRQQGKDDKSYSNWSKNSNILFWWETEHITVAKKEKNYVK